MGFITCKTPVRAVRLTRDKIVVVVQNSVEIYAWNKPKDPKELDRLSVYETADNLLGMICMSAKLAAFPGRTPGHVQIVENDTGNVSIIPAHSTPLRAMAFSPKGELLATASDHVSPCPQVFLFLTQQDTHSHLRVLLSASGTLATALASVSCVEAGTALPSSPSPLAVTVIC